MLNEPIPHRFPRPHEAILTGETTLDVMVMISNPVRYKSRYELFDNFKSQANGPHINFWLIEVAYGNRPFTLSSPDNPNDLRLRTGHEIWHKENALNLLTHKVLSQRPEAGYVAWVDADITFTRSNWAYETIQQLQHYDFVQMWSHAQDVDQKYRPINQQQVGFAYAYCNDMPTQAKSPKVTNNYYYAAGYGHPGYAWAARTSALSKVGGLIDRCVLGSADHHMALALVGQARKSIPGNAHANFKKMIMDWETRAERLVKRNIGYVDGLISHHWHGSKANRRYIDRWQLLVNDKFDPEVDVWPDAQGLFQLTDLKPKLRDDIRTYFRERDEDAPYTPACE